MFSVVTGEMEQQDPSLERKGRRRLPGELILKQSLEEQVRIRWRVELREQPVCNSEVKASIQLTMGFPESKLRQGRPWCRKFPWEVIPEHTMRPVKAVLTSLFALPATGAQTCRVSPRRNLEGTSALHPPPPAAPRTGILHPAPCRPKNRNAETWIHQLLLLVGRRCLWENDPHIQIFWVANEASWKINF